MESQLRGGDSVGVLAMSQVDCERSKSRTARSEGKRAGQGSKPASMSGGSYLKAQANLVTLGTAFPCKLGLERPRHGSSMDSANLEG